MTRLLFELENFCNTWLQVEHFRENSKKEWQPITPDMNSIRVTMVSELRELIQQEHEIIVCD